MTTLQPNELVLRVYVNGQSRPLVVAPGSTFADVVRLVGGRAGEVSVEEVWSHFRRPVDLQEDPHQLLSEWGIYHEHATFHIATCATQLASLHEPAITDADMKPKRSDKYHSLSVADVSPYRPDIFDNRYSSNDRQPQHYNFTDMKSSTLKVAGKYANRGEVDMLSAHHLNTDLLSTHQLSSDMFSAHHRDTGTFGAHTHQHSNLARAVVDRHKVEQGGSAIGHLETSGERRQQMVARFTPDTWMDTHERGQPLTGQHALRSVSTTGRPNQAPLERHGDYDQAHYIDNHGYGPLSYSEHNAKTPTYYNTSMYSPYNQNSSHGVHRHEENAGRRAYNRVVEGNGEINRTRKRADTSALMVDKQRQELNFSPEVVLSSDIKSLMNSDKNQLTQDSFTQYNRQSLLANPRDDEIGDTLNDWSQPIAEKLLQRYSTATADVHILRMELRKQYEEMQLRELKLKTELADTERRRIELASLDQQVGSLMTNRAIATSAEGRDKKCRPAATVSKVEPVSNVSKVEPVGNVSMVATVEPFNVSLVRQRNNNNAHLGMKTPGTAASGRQTNIRVKEKRADVLVSSTTSRSALQQAMPTVSATRYSEQARGITNGSSNMSQDTEAIAKATEKMRKFKSNFNDRASFNNQDQLVFNGSSISKQLPNRLELSPRNFNGKSTTRKASKGLYIPYGQQLTRSQSQFNISSPVPNVQPSAARVSPAIVDTRSNDQWSRYKARREHSSSPSEQGVDHYLASVETEYQRSLTRSLSSTCLPSAADSYTLPENKRPHVTIVNLNDSQDDSRNMISPYSFQQDELLSRMLEQSGNTLVTHDLLTTAGPFPLYKQPLVPLPGPVSQTGDGHLLPKTAFFSPLTIHTAGDGEEPQAPGSLQWPQAVHALPGAGRLVNLSPVSPRNPGLHTFASTNAINQTYTATRRQHTADHVREQSRDNTHSSAVNTLWSVISQPSRAHSSFMPYTETTVDEIELAQAELSDVSDLPQQVIPLDKTIVSHVTNKFSPTALSNSNKLPAKSSSSPTTQSSHIRLPQTSLAPPQLMDTRSDIDYLHASNQNAQHALTHFSGNYDDLKPGEPRITMFDKDVRDERDNSKPYQKTQVLPYNDESGEEKIGQGLRETAVIGQEEDEEVSGITLLPADAEEEVREGSPVNITCHQLALRKKREPDGEVKRVSFDTLSLLLDACSQGELDTIKSTLAWVSDISAANDEGTTALHNAARSNQYEVATLLLERGCTVNVADADGWTPLHCAASVNNVAFVKLLVEHGACVFAMTAHDGKRPIHKCRSDKASYDECITYLTEAECQLGVINDGLVYATCTYKADNGDELSVTAGDELRVLRRGDETERLWWWAARAPSGADASDADGTGGSVQEQGYIACNLLTAYKLQKDRSKSTLY